MIEPLLPAADLAAELTAPIPEGSGVRLWRLGQAGFVVRSPRATILVDLYLSNHCEAELARPFDHRRLSRAPIDPAELTTADVVVCTHDHLDHLDIPTMRTLGTASPDCHAVVPEAARTRLLALDWPDARVTGTRDGDRVSLVDGAVELEAFGVSHETAVQDPERGHLFQGYLLVLEGVSVAHVGDAVVDDHLRDMLAQRRPDILLLPINGRSEERSRMGFAGNMSAEEAVELAAEVAPRIVVPMHYDMFAQNVDDRALVRFVDAASSTGVPARVLRLGESLTFHENRGPA